MTCCIAEFQTLPPPAKGLTKIFTECEWDKIMMPTDGKQFTITRYIMQAMHKPFVCMLIQLYMTQRLPITHNCMS